MKPKYLLFEYIKRLFHQTWLWATAVIGVIALFVDIFSGGQFPVILYPIIFGLAVIVGGYKVFVDVAKEQESKEKDAKQQIEQLQIKIREIEEKRPRLVVGFQNNGQLARQVTLRLHPLPPEPEYDRLVEIKRIELLAQLEEVDRKREYSEAFDLDWRVAAVGLNPNFEQDVGEYLQDYRRYLGDRYHFAVYHDRAQLVSVMLENKGRYPADDVVLDFAFPKYLFLQPTDDYMFWMFQDKEPSPPKEPKPYRNLMDTVRGKDAMSEIYLRDLLPRVDQPPPPPSNTGGPTYTDTGDITHVTYKVKRLIQNLDEDGFEPIALWLGEVRESASWEIPVRIYSANLPEPDDEQLLLVAQIDSSE